MASGPRPIESGIIDSVVWRGAHRAAVFLCIALSACSSDTRIRVTVVGGDGIDSYRLRVYDRLGEADPLPTLELIVPDSFAGGSVSVELWGLRGGDQAAFGAATVTPTSGETVDVTVTFDAVDCGAFCEPDSVRCAIDGTNGTRVCQQAANGCVGWGPATACNAATPFCSNGACAATCSDECAAASECDGSVATRSCGEHDGDTCADWSDTVSCDAGQACSNGVCASSSTCTEGDVCEVRPPECLANSMRMYGLAGTCSATDGCMYGYVDATCATGCADGECNPRVAAGGQNACGLKADGSLACWGAMTVGTDVPTAKFKSISVSDYHGCGITTSGGTTCWQRGLSNSAGECDVPPGVSFRSVSVGELLSCGVKTNGEILCWGNNSMGQRLSPPGTFTVVSANADHACAIRTNGTAICWSQNDQGQSSAPGGMFTDIAAGSQFSCGIRMGGLLECWGAIEAPPPGLFVSLSAGIDHACALRTDGFVDCWGANTSNKATPPPGTYSSVSVGWQHSCGSRADGSVVCWGDNTSGVMSVPPGL